MAVGLGLIFRYPLVTDDPYITYRYALNLLAGNGMVYNAGERVLSTTTPLYTLLLALLGWFYPDIPALGYWISVLSYGVAAYFLYLLASGIGWRAGGALSGVILLAAPALVMTFGLETGFYLMLALGAFALYFARHVSLAFAVCALLTLTRNDGAIVTGLMAGHYLWSRRAVLTRAGFSRESLRALVPLLVYVVIFGPWLGLAWWYFGSPFPFTLAAKIAQAQSGLWDPFGVGFLKWARANALWLAPLLVFSAGGVVWAIRRRAPVLLVGAWALLHLAAYALLGVAFYPWYVAPLLPALTLFAGIGIEVGVREFGRRRFVFVIGKIPRQAVNPPPRVAVRLAPDTLRPPVLLLCVFLGLGLVWLELRADLAAGMYQPSPKVTAYARAAEWIRQNTPTDATVDALEVGIIGFGDERRTYDFVGLVDPAQIPYLRTQKFADGVRRRAADYVIAIPPDTWLPQDVWFKDAYVAVQRIRVKGFYNNRPLVIYQRAGVGETPVETRAVNAAFEKRIALSSVDLYAREIPRHAALSVRLHLQVLDQQPIPETWKFTLQLVGADNRILAQTDNFFPARLPADNQEFLDYQAIPIPGSAPPGTFDLILAMYDVKSGERLSLYDPVGSELGDLVNLGQVTIRN